MTKSRRCVLWKIADFESEPPTRPPRMFFSLPTSNNSISNPIFVEREIIAEYVIVPVYVIVQPSFTDGSKKSRRKKSGGNNTKRIPTWLWLVLGWLISTLSSYSDIRAFVQDLWSILAGLIKYFR